MLTGSNATRRRSAHAAPAAVPLFDNTAPCAVVGVSAGNLRPDPDGLSGQKREQATDQEPRARPDPQRLARHASRDALRAGGLAGARR